MLMGVALFMPVLGLQSHNHYVILTKYITNLQSKSTIIYLLPGVKSRTKTRFRFVVPSDAVERPMVKRVFWTLALPLLPNTETFAAAPTGIPLCRPPPLYKGPAAGTENVADDAQKPNEKLFKNGDWKTAFPGIIDDVLAFWKTPTLPPDRPFMVVFDGWKTGAGNSGLEVDACEKLLGAGMYGCGSIRRRMRRL